MHKLRIGDQVIWRGGWGRHEPKVAKITSIEVNCDPKYGDDVDEVTWDEIQRGGVVVGLDNGHWAYGDQISPLDKTLKG